ncbi:MAG: hypothetical protein ACI4VQ_05910 [Clostridia bacterium]
MGLLSLIKKFVNEGEVVEEELTGDLAVDPIVSYEASTNASHNSNVATQESQTVQRARATKSNEIKKRPTTSKTQEAIKTVEEQEDNEQEL